MFPTWWTISETDSGFAILHYHVHVHCDVVLILSVPWGGGGGDHHLCSSEIPEVNSLRVVDAEPLLYIVQFFFNLTMICTRHAKIVATSRAGSIPSSAAAHALPPFLATLG